MQPIYTKELLILKLQEIRDLGWILGAREGNHGSIGNTLEDLLGIEENNLPIPNAAEWELKTHKKNSKSLLTLFHLEPSPTALKFVTGMLIPIYGWKHKEAGIKHPETELSFRQTISCLGRSDRGFKVVVDRSGRKVLISFDPSAVQPHHADWLRQVALRGGLQELSPQPYWGFDDLYHKAATKLHNCFFVCAESKKINGKEYFRYFEILKLIGFDQEKFINAIEIGDILVDFDARSRKNHGTKFRFKNGKLPELYNHVEII